MNEQEKKRQKIYMICLMPTPPQKKPGNNWSFIMASTKPRPNPFDYAICGVFENKSIATSYPNICSFKTAIEEK